VRKTTEKVNRNTREITVYDNFTILQKAADYKKRHGHFVTKPNWN